MLFNKYTKGRAGVPKAKNFCRQSKEEWENRLKEKQGATPAFQRNAETLFWTSRKQPPFSGCLKTCCDAPLRTSPSQAHQGLPPLRSEQATHLQVVLICTAEDVRVSRFLVFEME